MKPMQTFALTVALLVAGCANTTSVQLASVGKSEFEDAVYSGQVVDIEAPIAGVDKYRVYKQGGSGFVSVRNVREGVEEIANGFCNRKGKAMHAVTEITSKPPHILGNFPRVELIFQCIERQDSKAATGDSGKYEKLASLKKLLDNGTLTQREFDAEKAKLLATP